MTSPLFVRADASPSIGLGHVGRAFALAEEIGSRLGTVPELFARADPVLASFLDGRRLDWTEIDGEGYAASEFAARLLPGGILVSDSYELDETGLDTVAAAGVRHLVIDDFAPLRHWPVDLVVNPNAGGERLQYPGAGRVLAGPQYALLRREILDAAHASPKTVGPVHTVLVSLGGGSWPKAGLALLEAVARELAGLTIMATVPPELAPLGVEPVDPRLLHTQLQAADIALLSGGVLKYEAAVCGLPGLLVALVPHQVEVAASFARTGAARALGPLEALDPAHVARQLAALAADEPARAAMSAAGRAAVDGRGAWRVAETLLGPSG